MKSLSVFDKVSSGAMSPEEGAKQLMAAREEERRRAILSWKPSWLPVWIFVITAGAILSMIAPFVSSRQKD
jgi:hypothetical protein